MYFYKWSKWYVKPEKYYWKFIHSFIRLSALLRKFFFFFSFRATFALECVRFDFFFFVRSSSIEINTKVDIIVDKRKKIQLQLNIKCNVHYPDFIYRHLHWCIINGEPFGQIKWNFILNYFENNTKKLFFFLMSIQKQKTSSLSKYYYCHIFILFDLICFFRFWCVLFESTIDGGCRVLIT